MNTLSNTYIVFQAYGNQDILNECTFALLSLCDRHNKSALNELEICIYTDRPDYFESFRGCPLNIEYRGVNPTLIKEWRGSIDFVHRVKIEVLRDFTQSHKGSILYLDTDVCFARPLTEIFHKIRDGKLYMHVMEGYVHHSENVLFQKLSRFITTTTIAVNNETVDIPANVTMWNAGVLGFNSKYAHLLEHVLQFTDIVYKQFPKHVVEQFAFSLYFQKMHLSTAHTHIYHYWNLKELRPLLNSFFDYFKDKNWEELVHMSRLIQLPDYMQQKANFYYNRSTAEKLFKKKWLPKNPDWSLLSKQL